MQAQAETDLLSSVKTMLTCGQIVLPQALDQEFGEEEMDSVDVVNVLRCAKRIALNVSGNRPAYVVSTDRMAVLCEITRDRVTVLAAWRTP